MGRRCAADSKMNTAQALGGRQALVTGGSRGIGYAVAQRLAGLGARITLMGRDADALDLAVGRLAGQAGFVRGDIAKRCQAVKAFAQTEEAVGRNDNLLNNDGQAESPRLDRIDEDARQRMNTVTLKSERRGIGKKGV